MTRVLLVNATRLGELPLEAFRFALGAEPDLEPDPFAAHDGLEINRLDFVLVEPGTDLTHDRADGCARRPVNLNLGRSSEHELFTPFPRSTANAHSPTACALSKLLQSYLAVDPRSSALTGPFFRRAAGEAIAES